MNRMSEVDKEVSVEKETPIEPAEVKEEPVETQLPCEQPEDKNNENKEEISEKKKKKKKKSKKKPTGRSEGLY